MLSTPPAIPAGTLADGPQPVLSAEGGLVLRPWAPSDHRFSLPPIVIPRSSAGTLAARTEDEVQEWFEQYRQDWAQEKGAHWAVTGGGEVLGRIAMGGLNLDDGVAGCAYWVLPGARGAGVARARSGP